MTKLYMLDASPLGKIAHAKAKPEISEWFKRIMASGARIIIPEIADYEVRRSLILEGLKKSIIKLNSLKETVEYLPITTEVMLKAANIWAEARRKGNPTADPKELDCDVVLAAQALSIDAVVITENVGHIVRYVDAKHWKDVEP